MDSFCMYTPLVHPRIIGVLWTGRVDWVGWIVLDWDADGKGMENWRSRLIVTD